MLCESLEPILAHRGVYLLLDMASSHIHDSIVELCMEKGVRAILVPAALTSLVQPLDTHVFKQNCGNSGSNAGVSTAMCHAKLGSQW